MYKHMKPVGGYFKCRACGRVWAGEQLYQDPQSTVLKWTCGDLLCGGTVDAMTQEEVVRKLNEQKGN